MDIKDIKLPTYTDKDLEWISNQPWFDILVNDNILARYGTWCPTALCIYPKYPDSCKNEVFCRHDNPKSEVDDKEAQYKKACYDAGFQIIGKGFEFGGMVDSSKIKLLLCYENPVSGQACGIGYCKQFDCNIGFTAYGKWMEDSNVFLLPKDYSYVSCIDIQRDGIWVGNEYSGGIKVKLHDINRYPELKTRNFVYKLR